MKTKSSVLVSSFSILAGIFARMVSVVFCISIAITIPVVDAYSADANGSNVEARAHNFGDNNTNKPLIDYCRSHDGTYRVNGVSEIRRQGNKVMVSVLLEPSSLNINGDPLKPIFMVEDISKLPDIVSTDFVAVKTLEIRRVSDKGIPSFSVVEVNVSGYKNACWVYGSVERLIHPVGCSAKDYFKDLGSKPKNNPGQKPKPEAEEKSGEKEKKPKTFFVEPKVT